MHYSDTAPFMSNAAKDLIQSILNPSIDARPTVRKILEHPWLTTADFTESEEGSGRY